MKKIQENKYPNPILIIVIILLILSLITNLVLGFLLLTNRNENETTNNDERVEESQMDYEEETEEGDNEDPQSDNSPENNLIQIEKCSEFSMENPNDWEVYYSSENSEYFVEKEFSIVDEAIVLENDGYYLMIQASPEWDTETTRSVTDQDDLAFLLNNKSELTIAGEKYYLDKQHFDTEDLNPNQISGGLPDDYITHLSYYEEDLTQFTIGKFVQQIERSDCTYQISKFSDFGTENQTYGDTPQDIQTEMMSTLETINW